MADFERTVLEHYQLPTAYPEEWPAEKDLSDASSDEEFAGKSKRIGMIRRSKSRYSALERSASDRRSLVPGSQKTGDGIENLVQKDEPDPLGTADSVVRILKQQGLPVQDDIDLRKYCKMLQNSLLMAFFREQIFAVVNYLFSCIIPLSSPQKCVNKVAPARA
jgi:exocyst complex component 2